MNYIKRFQNAQDLSVSVGNTYSGDQLMHTFMDNFHQGEKYSAQISSHQAALRRQEKITDQTSLSISSLQTDYLNIDISLGCGENSERAKLVQKKCTYCGCANHSAEKHYKNQKGRKNHVRLVPSYLSRIFSHW